VVESVDEAAVTPPREEPRPPVVTVAMMLWMLLGGVMVALGALYAIALVTGAADGGSSVLGMVAAMVVLAAAGVAVVLGARRVGRGSRPARSALSAVGGVLAALGLVQLTFLGVAGSWFLAFVVGVVLLHLPTARAWFAGVGS
jgi:hypothetical protein